MKKIIEDCRNKMYDAIWLEIDRDPQRPAVARADIKTKAGDICVWCDRTGNVAVVTHKNSNNDSERLEEAIEGCVDYQDVMDDWLEETADTQTKTRWTISAKAGSTASWLNWFDYDVKQLLYGFLQRQGKGRTQNSFQRLILVSCFLPCNMRKRQRAPCNGRASLGSWQGGVSFGSQLGFESPAFH